MNIEQKIQIFIDDGASKIEAWTLVAFICVAAVKGYANDTEEILTRVILSLQEKGLPTDYIEKLLIEFSETKHEFTLH